MAQIRPIQTAARQAPYSIEAEQAVLGGVLLDNRAWNDIADRLGEQDFYRADHQLIWRAICDLIGGGKPCDFVTLTEHLRHRSLLEEAGGLSYLGALANDTPSAANVQAYAELVRERSVLRSLVAAGGDIAEMGSRPEGRDTPELIDQAEQAVFAIRERGARARTDYQKFSPVLDQVYERIQTVRRNPGGSAGLPTGFREFDKATSGLGPGDLMILAARPSMGKTSLAMNIAENVAIERRQGVAVFSMEMSA
ncbi:MAG: replicative DNA helicase, partial [Panacagrimonas sp.]